MKKKNQNNNGGSGYQTVGQAAKAIGVSRQSVHLWINSGYIHAIWMLGQRAIHDNEVERVKELRQSEQAA